MQTDTRQPQPNSSARQWFVQVDDQPYGPFDDQMLWSFMCEGRVNPQSLISQTASSGFRPVSADPALMNWLSQVPSAAPAELNPEPKPKPAPTVFMIMAEVRSGRGMDLIQTLQGLGHVQRIGDAVWLLGAEATAEDVRNVLSQPLGSNDRLFVLDSFANETAWFNLSPDMDGQIAALWNIKRD
ncbi:hypothetical protein [Litorimonas sp. WD9-15]|uniref:hypothetical protein n=1 Tax=Litorimonas sp. WD9-15 TaxID=3418716 RepID=UPI003D00F1A1